MDIREFVADNGITMVSRSRKSNPNMDDFKGNHYTVTISMGDKRMSVAYSMGMALTGKPKIDDVLDCLANDAAGVENARNFEDWASEYGYDTDSRKAYGTYQILGEQAKQLRQWLGNAAYTQLTEQTERL